VLTAGLCERDLEFNAEENCRKTSLKASINDLVIRVAEPKIILDFSSEMSFKHPWLSAFNCH